MTLEKVDEHLNETKIKEDDRVVRTKTSDYLNMIRRDLKNFESGYRQEFLPPPSREKPFPDKKALAFVAEIKKIDLKIEHWETLVRGADSALDDKEWNRYKNKKVVLHELLQMDEQMMRQTTHFYEQLENVSKKDTIVSLIDTFLSEFEQSFKKRQEYLRVQVQKIEMKF